MHTTFYKIENSLNSLITEDEAQKYFKENTYFTEGKDIIQQNGQEKIQKSIIFDLDKNSILPEVRFLDKYEKSSGGSIGLLEIAIGLCVLGGIGYLAFSQTQNTGNNSPTSAEIPFIESFTPQTQNTGNNSPTSEDLNSLPLIQNEERAEKPQEQTENNIQYIEQLQEKDLKISQISYELETQRIENLAKEKQIQDLQKMTSEAKVDLNTEIQENLEKSEKIQNLKSKLISQNQLYLFLGKYVFGLCENQDDEAKCKSLIFQFYNERK